MIVFEVDQMELEKVLLVQSNQCLCYKCSALIGTNWVITKGMNLCVVQRHQIKFDLTIEELRAKIYLDKILTGLDDHFI